VASPARPASTSRWCPLNVDVSLVTLLNEVARNPGIQPVAVWVATQFAVLEVATLVAAGFALLIYDLRAIRAVRFSRVEGAATALVALAIGLALNHLIGAVWFRPRPFDAVAGVRLLTHSRSPDPSFPSDHATAAFCLAIGTFIASPRLSAILMGQALMLVTARIAVGLHYPSDIVGGLFVALISVGAASIAAAAASARLATSMPRPIAQHVRWDSRDRPAFAGGKMAVFSLLVGLPLVLEVAAGPMHVEPEWIQIVLLMVLAFAQTIAFLGYRRWVRRGRASVPAR